MAAQYQEDLAVVRPIVRGFDMEVGHLVAVSARVPGRHALQTSGVGLDASSRRHRYVPEKDEHGGQFGVRRRVEKTWWDRMPYKVHAVGPAAATGGPATAAQPRLATIDSPRPTMLSPASLSAPNSPRPRAALDPSERAADVPL